MERKRENTKGARRRRKNSAILLDMRGSFSRAGGLAFMTLAFLWTLSAIGSFASAQAPLPPYQITVASEKVSQLPHLQFGFIPEWDLLVDAGLPEQFQPVVGSAIAYTFIVGAIGIGLAVLLCILGCCQACSIFSSPDDEYEPCDRNTTGFFLIFVAVVLIFLATVGMVSNSRIFKQVDPVVQSVYSTVNFYANDFETLTLLAPNLTELNVNIPEAVYDTSSYLNELQSGIGSVATPSGDNYDVYNRVIRAFRYGGWAPWLLVIIAAFMLAIFAFTANRCTMAGALLFSFIAFDLLCAIVVLYSTPSILFSTECSSNIRTEIINATQTFFQNNKYGYYDNEQCLVQLTEYYLFCYPLNNSSYSYNYEECSNPLDEVHGQIQDSIEHFQQLMNRNPNSPQYAKWNSSVNVLEQTDAMVLGIAECGPLSSAYSSIEEAVCWTFANGFSVLFLCTLLVWLAMFVAIWATYLGVGRLDSSRQSSNRQAARLMEGQSVYVTESTALLTSTPQYPLYPQYSQYYAVPTQPNSEMPGGSPGAPYQEVAYTFVPQQPAPAPAQVVVVSSPPVVRSRGGNGRACLIFSMFILVPLISISFGVLIWALTQGSNPVTVY